MMFDPAGLYGIVEQYAAFGNHHTGTDADRATTDWLVDLLQNMGGTVERDAYSFDRFVPEASLTVDGQAVPSLPLFYSGTGEFDTSDFETMQVDAGLVGNAHKFASALSTSETSTPLVIAIDGPDDLPVQCNRVPTALLGRPAVIIAGNWLSQVRGGAHLRFSAHIEPGESANVIATFGDPSHPEVMITTPLTGWTPAAGERGTGLAVALTMAAALATQNRVVFSACSGHEIDHVGLRHYLSTRDLHGRLAVHLGASVAATEPAIAGPPVLGDQRMVLTTATGDTRSAIAARIPDANWTMPDLDPPWPGEGGTWQQAGAQVLSFLGGASLFHTTDDVPDKATTPDALKLAADTAIDATQLFLRGCR
jgi:hypothetical protein